MTYTEIDLPFLLDITRAAGAAIMKIYEKDFTVEYKDDKSPLTDADRLSNKVIIDGLMSRYPGSNVISEENKTVPYEDRKDWSTLWLIDPIDGTKEFIKKNGEFTVNIALIEDGVPTFGVVYAPVPDTLYYGIKGDGSYKVEKGISTKIHNTTSYRDKDIVKVVASRSHMSEETLAFVSDIEKQGKKIDFLSIGSSLKLCLVAEGAADIYPRFGPTMEWDTGAAHAVALYAGREVLNADIMQPLVYNKPNLLNPSFIVQ
jgi:3'(2'), 5'-bisphosphate nucleotidase